VCFREIPSILKGAEIVIVPSRREPFGLVVVEAMAAGVPVIATRVGGIKEVMEIGRGGILVERENRTQLFETILYLLRNESERRRLVEEGKVEYFRIEKTVSKYISVFNNA